MKLIRLLLACSASAFAASSRAALAGLGAADDFILAGDLRAAPFVIEAGTDRAVARAADDVRDDVERVCGARPAMLQEFPAHPAPTFVIAGVIGQSAALDRLAAAGKLDVSRLAGSWESFVIQVVTQPCPGVDRALVIAGGDRRGAIYGLYEISAAIGVSPWRWWADVVPPKKATLRIAGGLHRFGPPSVRYRGIFLNDEDWGLQPWAAKTFEPETRDIGPKTYAKIFELLLRLKGNTVWPAMHPTTRAFNHYPRNKEVADEYGVVMGSSHAESMLRNNVDEWTAPKEDYNYVTNRAGVLRYWEQRVRENGRFENIYTLGMRGIHDSAMQGAATDAERSRVLEQVFADQRELLARHVRPEVGQVPQMFCAYKEVLDLYRQGLRVPGDVTIVWPDDNFGYIRNFATAEERRRPGGFGVYYHVSYLGRPLSYLWLCTTPPALIWQQLRQAYAHGADRIWIVNVGDLKPAEIATEFFLQLAWDIDRWRPETLPGVLPTWAAREFGPEHAAEIAALMNETLLLNFQRKPEHLQWWLPGQPRQPSALTTVEVQERLDAFARLRTGAEALRGRMPAAQQDAFYQLVCYPVVGSALANERFFEGERGRLELARAAAARLADETRYFNEELAGGKWRHLLSEEPADRQWSSMRIEPWAPPTAAVPLRPAPAAGSSVAVNAGRFVARRPGRDAAWTVVPGLGRTGEAITLLPSTQPPIELAAASDSAPEVSYDIILPAAGTYTLDVHLLPTHPVSGDALRLAVALDDARPQLVSLHDGGTDAEWAQGVLNAVRVARTKLVVPAGGRHTLRVYGLEAGVVIDKLVIDLGALAPTYLGPPSQP